MDSYANRTQFLFKYTQKYAKQEKWIIQKFLLTCTQEITKKYKNSEKNFCKKYNFYWKKSIS